MIISSNLTKKQNNSQFNHPIKRYTKLERLITLKSYIKHLRELETISLSKIAITMILTSFKVKDYIRTDKNTLLIIKITNETLVTKHQINSIT